MKKDRVVIFRQLDGTAGIKGECDMPSSISKNFDNAVKWMEENGWEAAVPPCSVFVESPADLTKLPKNFVIFKQRQG